MQQSERKERRRRRRWSPQHFQRSVTALAESCAVKPGHANVLQRTFCYVRRLVDAYGTHQCSLMACACAYCALLSLVPLLVIGIAGLGFFVGGSHAAQDQVLVIIRSYVPIDVQFLRGVLNHILDDSGLIGLYGLLGLLFAAHQTFLAMEPAMNMVWNVPETRHWLRQRLVAFSVTFVTVALLGANIAVSALLAYLESLKVPLVPGHVEAWLLQECAVLLPVLLTTLLFTILYVTLPSRVVPVKAAILGAAVAALLWELTKKAFVVYLANVHSYDRIYGPVSVLVILVVWIYYSMAILLLGAEVAADYEATRHSLREAEARAHSVVDLAAASGTALREEEAAASLSPAEDPSSAPPADLHEPLP